MTIEYENEKVNKFFADWEYIKKKCGLDVARSLKKRYDQIKASEYLAIFAMLGHTEQLKTERQKELPKWTYSTRIDANLRLIFYIPNKEEISNIAEITKSDTIKIIGVCDYHGAKYEWLIK